MGIGNGEQQRRRVDDFTCDDVRFDDDAVIRGGHGDQVGGPRTGWNFGQTRFRNAQQPQVTGTPLGLALFQLVGHVEPQIHQCLPRCQERDLGFLKGRFRFRQQLAGDAAAGGAQPLGVGPFELHLNNRLQELRFRLTDRSAVDQRQNVACANVIADRFEHGRNRPRHPRRQVGDSRGVEHDLAVRGDSVRHRAFRDDVDINPRFGGTFLRGKLHAQFVERIAAVVFRPVHDADGLSRVVSGQSSVSLNLCQLGMAGDAFHHAMHAAKAEFLGFGKQRVISFDTLRLGDKMFGAPVLDRFRPRSQER